MPLDLVGVKESVGEDHDPISHLGQERPRLGGTCRNVLTELPRTPEDR
jgi:hypothetical protein